MPRSRFAHSSWIPPAKDSMRAPICASGFCIKALIVSLNFRRLCEKVRARSSRIARSWFMSMARMPTKRYRTRCRLCMSSCSCALRSHEAHDRACCCLRYGLGITVVVLLRFDVGRNIHHRHRADGVALRFEQSSEMIGATARPHSHDASRQLGVQTDDRLTSCAMALSHHTGHIEADEAAAVFAEIDTQHSERALCDSKPLHVAMCDERYVGPMRGGPFHKPDLNPRRSTKIRSVAYRGCPQTHPKVRYVLCILRQKRLSRDIRCLALCRHRS